MYLLLSKVPWQPHSKSELDVDQLSYGTQQNYMMLVLMVSENKNKPMEKNGGKKPYGQEMYPRSVHKVPKIHYKSHWPMFSMQQACWH